MKRKNDFYDVNKLKGILKSIVAFTVILLCFVYCEYYFISSDNFRNEEKTKQKLNVISLNIGETINLSNYISNIEDVKYTSFKNEDVFEMDYEYNIMGVQEGEDELKILYKDNTDQTLYFNAKTETSNAQVSKKNLVKTSIKLDDQGATNPGVKRIYVAYFDNDGEQESINYYLDSSYTRNMTTIKNKINIPSKTNYTFKGYYTGRNGKGIKVINENGYIVSNLNIATKKLYAYWK